MKSKIISGYPNYKIYNNGKIEKLSPMARKGGVFMTPSFSVNGYHRVSLMNNGKSKTFMLHRLIAEHFIDGKTKNKKYINHKDGNKINNSLENLEWCTMSFNTRHAYLNGLSKKKGKLTISSVRTIRESKLSYRKLADHFKVSHTAIKKIKKDISYKWLE